MRTQSGTVIELKDYKPSDYMIDRVELLFELAPAETIVTSTLRVKRRQDVDPATPLFLDGDDLTLVSLKINGTDVSADAYVLDDDGMRIVNVPSEPDFELCVVTKINPTDNKKLMGLYRTSGNFCTQCEAEGFRRITYYLDRPDVLAVFTVRIQGDEKLNPLLLSNGNCIEKGKLPNGQHLAVWHDPHPKPSYLFALFAGDLGVVKDRFTTKSGRDVALEIYVEHGKEERAAYAMDALIRSMRWDEEVYGREYDLDVFMIVAVSDFNMGAMENKGLNIFNDRYVLADQQTATDQDYANIEAIIAHEYFHNWTGNRITCRDWFQLCLKEGLTVYRDHSFSADQRSASVKRIAEVRALRAHQFPEDNGPLTHPVRPRKYSEINNFYTATVYEKGSEVIRMLRAIVGDDGFNAGMELYFERHDGDAATIEDFIACFSEAANTDLEQFSLWYDQSGTPNLAITTSYDENDRRFVAEISQSLKSIEANKPTQPMHIPVRFGLVGADGADLRYESVSGADVSGDVIHLRQKKHTIVFDGVESKPVLSALRGFSAPVTTIPPRAEEELIFLAQKDRDDFGRWEALTSLLMIELRKLSESFGDSQAVEPSTVVCDIITNILRSDELEPAYKALALALPSEADIAREIGTSINPDAIFAARNAMLNMLAHECSSDFSRICEEAIPSGPFSPDAVSAGQRALHNIALAYLCRSEGDTSKALALFNHADNMTDRAAALNILTQQAATSKETVDALNHFKSMYSHEPIVLDKWFSVQAMVPGAETLDRVKQLTKDDIFSFENPNRVRALIGAFTTGNATGFNRADGAGYEFLCETVEHLDGLNPQVAARLLTAMRSWRNLEETRKAAAQRHLEDLAAKPKLSRDLRDIVQRSLG